jgi:hypothetical protein
LWNVADVTVGDDAVTVPPWRAMTDAATDCTSTVLR